VLNQWGLVSVAEHGGGFWNSRHSKYKPLATTTKVPSTTAMSGTWPKTSQPNTLM
jgi:hypothetical protein